MANITVNSTQIRAKKDQLSALNKNFKAAVTNLSDSERTLATMWEGDAQAEFRRTFNKDIVMFNAFHDAVEKYIATLEKIAQEYDRTEQANVRLAKEH